LKEETLDRTTWRAPFGRGFGPVVRQTTKRMNAYDCGLPFSGSYKKNKLYALPVTNTASATCRSHVVISGTGGCM